jgi:hypothetical protein
LLLSEGKTKDPVLAAMMDDTSLPTLKTKEMLDAEQRDGLRKMMGFDFEVKVRPNKVHVFSLSGPRVTAHAKLKPGDVDHYGNITNPDLIDRMVAACVKLKERHDAACKRWRNEKLKLHHNPGHCRAHLPVVIGALIPLLKRHAPGFSRAKTLPARCIGLHKMIRAQHDPNGCTVWRYDELPNGDKEYWTHDRR